MQYILVGTADGLSRALMLGVPEDDAGRKGGADPAATRTGTGGSAEIAGQHCWSAARRAKEVDGLDQARTVA